MAHVFEAETKPKRMLWGLMFLKLYDTETVNADAKGCSERTFRKKSWDTVNDISELNLISKFHNIW